MRFFNFRVRASLTGMIVLISKQVSNLYYAMPLIGIERCSCLTSDVCLSRTSGLTRKHRGLGKPNLARVTCDLDTTFKVKGQGQQAALLSAALTREAGAAVTVRTYWAWETTATLRLLGAREALGRPRGGEGLGHIVSPRAQLVLLYFHTWSMKQVYTIPRPFCEIPNLFPSHALLQSSRLINSLGPQREIFSRSCDFFFIKNLVRKSKPINNCYFFAITSTVTYVTITRNVSSFVGVKHSWLTP